MGQGYTAGFSIHITNEDVDKLELESYNEFVNQLKLEGVTFDAFAEIVQYIEMHYTAETPVDTYVGQIAIDFEEKEESIKCLLVKYNAFKEEFKLATKISIWLNYHNQDTQGDLYDDIDGGFFALNYDEVYVLSDAAKELQKVTSFQTAHFVVYG